MYLDLIKSYPNLFDPFLREAPINIFQHTHVQQTVLWESWYCATSEETETQEDYTICLWSPNWLDT